jgi:hypothetical protein
MKRKKNEQVTRYLDTNSVFIMNQILNGYTSQSQSHITTDGVSHYVKV